MSCSNVISIKNLVNYGLNEYINYKNTIVISFIKDLSLFESPCHLRAITILVCLSGELEGHINLHPFKVGKYSIIINFPENIIHINKMYKLRAFAILLSPEFLQNVSPDIHMMSRHYAYEVNKNEYFELPRGEIKTLANYLSIIRSVISSPLTPASEDLLKYLSAAFTTNIMMMHQRYHVKPTNQFAGSKTSNLIFDKFIEIVKAYHFTERELNFYADRMCMSTKHLSSTIMRVSGKKATQWIADYVILEAKSMLRYSGKNIQEISQKLNFPSQSAFGKYFKSQVGMSPTEFMDNTK